MIATTLVSRKLIWFSPLQVASMEAYANNATAVELNSLSRHIIDGDVESNIERWHEAMAKLNTKALKSQDVQMTLSRSAE